jgi:hypothetical protein
MRSDKRRKPRNARNKKEQMDLDFNRPAVTGLTRLIGLNPIVGGLRILHEELINMPSIFCPKCGREVEPDADVRFCRYCGLELSETRDNMLGFSEVRREGYKFINLSFVLVGVLFWIQYFGLISWTSFWGGNLLLILIFGFIFGLWFMGNWVVDRPAKYVTKRKSADPEPAKGLPPGEPVPAADMISRKTTGIVERPGVTDSTTRRL